MYAEFPGKCRRRPSTQCKFSTDGCEFSNYYQIRFHQFLQSILGHLFSDYCMSLPRQLKYYIKKSILIFFNRISMNSNMQYFVKKIGDSKQSSIFKTSKTIRTESNPWNKARHLILYLFKYFLFSAASNGFPLCPLTFNTIL